MSSPNIYLEFDREGFWSQRRGDTFPALLCLVSHQHLEHSAPQQKRKVSCPLPVPISGLVLCKSSIWERRTRNPQHLQYVHTTVVLTDNICSRWGPKGAQSPSAAVTSVWLTEVSPAPYSYGVSFAWRLFLKNWSPPVFPSLIMRAALWSGKKELAVVTVIHGKVPQQSTAWLMRLRTSPA